MSIAISAQMNQSLINLTSIADSTQMTQGRLASGLAIASASDNISVYFKAKSYADKSDALDTTNKGISQAVANLDVVDKALSNMQDNLKGATQLMQDARAKAVTVQRAATTVGDAVYGTRTIGTGATARTLRGDIVQPKALLATDSSSKADSGSYFQVGDVIAITLRDSASTTGAAVTKYFRATDPDAALPTTAVDAAGNPVNANGASKDAAGNPIPASQYATSTGATYNQALNFNDLGSLSDAIQGAFGLDSITTNLQPTTVGTTTTYKLGFALTSNSTSLTFNQANDQAVGIAGALDPGSAIDFTSIFGKLQNANNTTFGVLPTPSSDALTFQKGTTATTVNTGQTFASTGGTATGADAALQSRLDAANFFRQTLLGLDNLVKDASLPGYANVLKGEQLAVNLNDVGDVKQIIQLTQKGDPLSLGFAGYNVSGTGVVNTTNTTGNFATDASIDASITQAKNAAVLLKQIQTILAAAKVSMNSRLDYNKTVVTTLSQGANSLTAADSTQEAANLAALQNRQSFGVNNMSITKQAEQSLIQILR